MVLTILLGGSLSLAETASAQSPDTLSAGLARRIAAEVDSRRDGRAYWYVANPRPPYTIFGVFGTRDSAAAAIGAFPLGRLFGPLSSPRDFDRPGPGFIMLDCKHLMQPPQASNWDPPLPVTVGPYCPERIIPLDQIQDVVLTVLRRVPGGVDTIRVNLWSPVRADAVFLTSSAIQKFVLPYYTNLFSPAYAARLWDSVVARVGRMP